jgi:hypothetical protein
MKRTSYLGALLPFTTATSFTAMAGGESFAEEDPGNPARSKRDAADDAKHENSTNGAADDSGGAKLGIQTPAAAAAAEAAQIYEELSNIDPGVARNDGPVPIIHSDVSGMYSSQNGSGGFNGKHVGSGGLGGVILTSSGEETPEEIPSEVPPTETGDDPTGDPPPGEGPPDDTGIVIPPAEDDDAMLILLGGTAEGSGDGASSSGEVDLDVVDYGAITVGYGYAIYSATGGDSAHAFTFAEVEGADLVYTFGNDWNFGGQAYSVTYVVAIDIEEDAFAQDPVWLAAQAAGWDHPFAGFFNDGEADDVSADGNIGLLSLVADVQDLGSPSTVVGGTTGVAGVGSAAAGAAQSEQASLSLNAQGTGAETFASASGGLLEVEDQFSSVTGAVTVIA